MITESYPRGRVRLARGTQTKAKAQRLEGLNNFVLHRR